MWNSFTKHYRTFCQETEYHGFFFLISLLQWGKIYIISFLVTAVYWEWKVGLVFPGFTMEPWT